jgi:hypothetical protein
VDSPLSLSPQQTTTLRLDAGTGREVSSDDVNALRDLVGSLREC